MQDDPLGSFCEQYGAGEGCKALRQLMSTPDYSLDRWLDASIETQRILDYADSLAFGWPDEARQANVNVQTDASLGPFQEALYQDELLLWLRTAGCNNGSLPWSETFGEFEANYARWLRGEIAINEITSEGLSPRLTEHMLHLERWRRFCSQFFAISQTFSTPATTLPLLFDCPQPPPLPLQNVLAIFIEPVVIDWEAWLSPLARHQAVLLFPDVVTLQHCLAIPAIERALESGDHLFHVLDHHPTDVMAQQVPIHGAVQQIISVADRPAIHPYIGPLEAALATVLGGPITENGAANALLILGRRLSSQIRGGRLGSRRLAAHRFNCEQRVWHDRHKGEPAPNLALGPPSLPHTKPKKFPRVFARKGLQRIAHVVPQLVDGGHAPTRLYRTLMSHHDRSRYEVHLFMTEEYAYRTSQYPFFRYYSLPSIQRAPATLELMKQLGISVWLADSHLPYPALAAHVADELIRRHIDLAIFHTPSTVSRLIVEKQAVSMTALFDHGALATDGGFDLYVAATAEEATRPFDGPLVFLPHVVDVREGWLCDNPNWGLPPDAQILTTISFHLDDRLSDPMCEAIALILERCPKAYYCPIGPISDRAKGRIEQFFRRRGVESRLRWLGKQDHPSHLARFMTLYLNEFPVGSGVALLDAMAAGLPIVSMYDPHGPHQARYGANAYGMERVVTSGCPGDYVELACRLLDDTALRKEWAEAALQSYEKRGSARDYVRRFEALLNEHWVTHHEF